MADVCVLGSGGWGTAVAILLSENGHKVSLWSYAEQECEELKKYRENKPFLPGIKIPGAVEFTSDIAAAKGKDLIVIATPSHGVRGVAKRLRGVINDNQLILNISKGIEEGSYKTISEILGEELPSCRIAVMSGPSHAEEVSRGVPTTNVVAAKKCEDAEFVQDVFMSPVFRVYTNDDIVGVELGGSLKNVIALCCGILDGMGMGDNTKAALMTRGLVEMTRLATAMGADPETLSGLSGVGDLIVTCTSMHSRNRRAGILIGGGMTAEEAQNEVKMVVEGVKSCRAAKELADKLGVEMPIVSEAYEVLFNNKPPREAVADLMGRDKKKESEKDFLHINN